MADDNRGARHSAAARRRAAKERQKARAQAQAVERQLAKDAEREAKRLDKERKHAKGNVQAAPDEATELTEEIVAVEQLLAAEDTVAVGIETAEAKQAEPAVTPPPGLEGAYHAAVATETGKADATPAGSAATHTADAPGAESASETAQATEVTEQVAAPAVAADEADDEAAEAERAARPRRADKHKRGDKKASEKFPKPEKEPESEKAPVAKKPSGPSGWVATFAAIGIVVLLIVTAVVAYQVFIVNRPPAAVRQTQSQAPVVTSGSGAASGGKMMAALASLGSLGPALTAPLSPLPGNPELAERLFVVAGGDVMMDRRVSELIESEGGSAPLADVASILKRGDIAILNLETPLSTRGEPRDKDVTFEGNPKGVESLVSAGIDAVTLANNHALDYGDVALKDTLDLLDKNKIAHTGAGMNSKEAWKPAIVTVKGKRVAYLGWSYIEPGEFVAGSDSAGIAGAKGDPTQIADAIKKAKKQADFVIVSFHWGVEYTDYPVDNQKELGRLAIDSGADLVASHHPHVIQGIEIYKDKLIAYSLGDFVFDHYSRKTGEAFILEVKLNRKKTLSAQAIPVYLSEMGQPQVVTGEEADSILGRLKEISDGFGTKMKIANDVATIQLGK